MGSCCALLLSSSKEVVRTINESCAEIQIISYIFDTYSLHGLQSCSYWLNLETNDLIRHNSFTAIEQLYFAYPLQCNK